MGNIASEVLEAISKFEATNTELCGLRRVREIIYM